MRKEKKYNSVKVRNPGHGHSVCLKPRQAFQLILGTGIGGDPAAYEVELKSDFLVLEEVSYDSQNNQDVYCFAQKFDLSDWSKISTIFLGNIIIVSKSSVPVRNILCVFLECAENVKNNVLTIVNPDGHLLKIEPIQILHVVVSDDKPRWTLIGIENVGMNCIRSETVYNDQVGVYDTQHLFCPEPRNIDLPVNKELGASYNCVYQQACNLRENRKIAKEYHFWTHFGAESLRKSHGTSNGNYAVGKVVFNSRNENNEMVGEREFDLLLGIRGSNNVNASQYQAIRYFGKNWNIRHCNTDRSALLCPNISENLDITKNLDTIYVEIPAPCVYFSCDSACCWFSEKDLDPKMRGMVVKELTPRHVNGYPVQRFLITNIKEAAPPGDLSFVGAIRFWCKQQHEIIYTNKHFLAISLWKVKQACELPPIPLNGTFNHHYRDYYGFDAKTGIYNNNEGWRTGGQHKEHQPRILAWEVELEQCALVSLTDDASFVKLQAIDPNRKALGCNAADYGYEDILLSSSSSAPAITYYKKKRKYYHHHHHRSNNNHPAILM